MTPPAPTRPNNRAVIVVGVVLALAVIGAGISSHTRQGNDIPVSTPTAERDLQFEDLMDGGVLVRDAATHGVVATITGENGFLRATLRGLAQQRRRENTDQVTPFRLTAWADNRLTLDDPVTGRHVELEAFGETNENVFLPLLGRPPVIGQFGAGGPVTGSPKPGAAKS